MRVGLINEMNYLLFTRSVQENNVSEAKMENLFIIF